jgi:hypothetical protein
LSDETVLPFVSLLKTSDKTCNWLHHPLIAQTEEQTSELYVELQLGIFVVRKGACKERFVPILVWYSTVQYSTVQYSKNRTVQQYKQVVHNSTEIYVELQLIYFK